MRTKVVVAAAAAGVGLVLAVPVLLSARSAGEKSGTPAPTSPVVSTSPVQVRVVVDADGAVPPGSGYMPTP